jgi:hypothetical protein
VFASVVDSAQKYSSDKAAKEINGKFIPDAANFCAIQHALGHEFEKRM